MIYYGDKMAVVEFATALQKHSADAWQSTTIMRVGKSEVYSVSIAIGILSVDIVAKEARNFSGRLTSTLPKNTHRVYLSRKE